MLFSFLRRAALPLFILATSACGEVVVDGKEGKKDEGAPTFCGEEVGEGEGTRVVLSNARAGVLLGDEDALYMVEQAGLVVRIDRCTGATTELADTGQGNTLAALLDGFVYWLHDEGGPSSLHRVPTSGGAHELVIDGLSDVSAIGAFDHRLFLKRKALLGIDKPGPLEVYTITVGPGGVEGPTLIASLPHVPQTTNVGFAVSAAGIFYANLSKCCDTPTYRLPLEGGEDAEVEGAEGGVRFFATAEWLYFARWESDIFRVRTEGGAPEPLAEPQGGFVPEVLADDARVCWVAEKRAPRCAQIGAASEVQVLGEDVDEPAANLVFAGDGVYWIRGVPSSGLAVILGAPR